MLSLTRAQKNEMVAELARRLSAASENYVWAQTASNGVHLPGFKPGEHDYYARQQRRLNAALVRVAAFRTVD